MIRLSTNALSGALISSNLTPRSLLITLISKDWNLSNRSLVLSVLLPALSVAKEQFLNN